MWISTPMVAIVVAIVVAIAVPVSQLRIVSFLKSCCCPDPAYCQCPDHQEDSSPQPSMRECHSTERMMVAPELPTFRAPVVAVASAPVVAQRAADHIVLAPHPEPPPARPDAPS